MTAVLPSAAHESGTAAHLVVLDTALLESLTVDGADGHHLARVRRLGAGAHLTVADGSGIWRRYEVTAARHGTLELAAVATEQVEAPPARALSVMPALSKGTKLETIAAHLTELGVAEIAPVVLDRSVLRPDESGRRRLHERLVESVRLAAMQARRSRLPVMRPPGELDVAALAALSPGRVLVAHHGAEPAPRLPEGALTVVTGPEGGFSPAELARFAEFRAIWWGLGNFVLRAETAPLAAAARLLV